jgi:hypothetical protein
MAPESSSIEQAIVRALRDNLERIQRSGAHHRSGGGVMALPADERFHRCSGRRPPAAALAASLEVLSRFMVSCPAPRCHWKADYQPGRQVAPPPTPARHLRGRHHGPQVQAEPRRAIETELETSLAPAATCRPTTARSPASLRWTGLQRQPTLSEEQNYRRDTRGEFRCKHQSTPTGAGAARPRRKIYSRLREHIEKLIENTTAASNPSRTTRWTTFLPLDGGNRADGDAHALGDYPYVTPARHH